MTHRRLVKWSVAYWVAVATFMAMFAVRSASAQGPPAAAVRVDQVRMERVQERRMITGDIRAVRRSRIAAQEPGIVVEMPVREGEIIEKNPLLAQLDSSRLSIELRQLEANQQVLQSAIRERQLLLQLERNDAESMRMAYERQGANAKEMRDADTALSVAQARLAQAEHQVTVLKARIDLLTKRVADMGIRAPFSGLVVAKHTDIGEWVGEGDAVVELVSVDAVEVWLDVPQDYFDSVRGNKYSVAIEIESTGRAYQSSTHRVIAQLDPKARMFSLVVPLGNLDGDLAPGMSVLGWVPTGVEGNHLTVSKNAVLRSDAGPYVYVVRQLQDGDPPTAVRVPVQILFPQHVRYVVRTRELQESDLVVVEGNERLFPMSPIKPLGPGEESRTLPTEDGS